MRDTLRRNERKNWFYSYNMIFEQPISESAKLIYLYLCRCADGAGQSSVEYEIIAEKCSIKSSDIVLKALLELEVSGLLIIESVYNYVILDKVEV